MSPPGCWELVYWHLHCIFATCMLQYAHCHRPASMQVGHTHTHKHINEYLAPPFVLLVAAVFTVMWPLLIVTVKMPAPSWGSTAVQWLIWKGNAKYFKESQMWLRAFCVNILKIKYTLLSTCLMMPTVSSFVLVFWLLYWFWNYNLTKRGTF